MAREFEEMPRLCDLQKATVPATENLAVRVDMATKRELDDLKKVYGPKTVATWLRAMIQRAVAEERGLGKSA